MAYSVPTAKLALTLSALAYVDENTVATQEQMIEGINTGLRAAGYSDWAVAWGPALDFDRSNMLYVAADAARNQFAVTVRGTDWSFWLDWIEDFDNFLPLTPYSTFGVPVGADVKIAQGTGIGLAALLAMNDGTGNLRTFVTGKAQAASMLVTGHSLGGCLASALAPCIAQWRGGAAEMSVYTFAAPTPGNRAFADYYNNLFVVPNTPDGGTAFRFYNSLDVVPNAWATLPTVETYYPPQLPCPGDVKDVVDFAAKRVGAQYAQLGSGANGSAVELPGRFLDPFGFEAAAARVSPIGDALFLLEADQQHHPTTYQQLLDAPSVGAVAAKLKRVAAKVRVMPA